MKGIEERKRFVESHISKGIAYQIRSLRGRDGLTQEQLAERVGMTQNAIYRLENPRYGKPTITTLKRIAAAFDVALIVRFVPYSQLVDWVSGTPRTDLGLTHLALAVPSFSEECGITLIKLGSVAEKETPKLEKETKYKLGSIGNTDKTIEDLQRTRHSAQAALVLTSKEHEQPTA